MKIVQQLTTQADDSNANCVELLEEALEMAKSGEILSVGICASLKENKFYEAAAGGVDTSTLVCASVVLTDRIKSWLVE